MSGASPGTPMSNFELDASPAKNTRSHTKHTIVSPTPNPILESPTKKRRTKADVTHLDVWDKTDDEIIIFLQLKCSSSKWAIYSDNEDEDVTSVHPDSMDAYLNTPCISRTKILAAGGILHYWENARATRPRLAQMALDFLSAPGGRLQTFKAQMAVGSWYKTPLMDDLGAVTSIMRTKMAKGKGKASGKGKSNEIVIDSD
ncbi:hypothetical protein BDR03DRAFT_986142 [Suillus americanus]|nr:hypothetical protein BDR03DRAFT_986142 [Suillus americanus]